MEGEGNYRQSTGRNGEELVCRLLEEKGHTILERNWRSGHKEIDIISLNADGIHFVEVKSRRKNIQVPPQYNVDARKRRNITKAAASFLRTSGGLPYRNMECSFDIAAVVFTEESIKVDLLEQAYIPIFI